MAYLGIVVRLALRSPVRALITTLAVSVSLVAFLTLRALVSNWYTVRAEMATHDQLDVRHKISVTFPLYRRMAEKIRALPGVEAVSAMVWFSGTYKDDKTRFGQLAVEGESYFEVHPEYLAAPEQMQAYLADLSGALVGRDLAKKYGWKLGDKVTLNGTIYRGDWDFTVRAIYDGANDATDRSRFYMHYKHVAPRNEHAHRLVVKARPEVARRIDAEFANTDTPTKTESQLAVQRSWASWSSGVIAAIDVGALVIVLVLILVLGNAMAMAVRDGAREYATLRAIGCRPRLVIGLVMAEAFLVTFMGLALGVGMTPGTLKALSALLERELGGMWQLELRPEVAGAAIAVALMAAVLASALPAWRAGRRRIVEASRAIA